MRNFYFIFFIILQLICYNLFSQVFEADQVNNNLPFSLNGANGTCNSPGIGQPNIIEIDVSGVGVLSQTNALARINLTLTNCGSGTKNMNLIAVRIMSPQGTCVGIYNGGLSTSASGIHDYTFLSPTACTRNPWSGGTNSSGVSATNSSNYGVFNASWNSLGVDLTDSFLGESADGVWKLIFSENTISEPCVGAASLQFGNPIVEDRTADGNICVEAILWDGRPMCIATGGKTASPNQPGRNGAQTTNPIYFDGNTPPRECEWNASADNEVWIKYISDTDEQKCISISGLDFSLQSIIVTDVDTDGDENPCTGANGGRYWKVVSCPRDNTGAVYDSPSGTRRNQNHCFTPEIGRVYYIVVDGNAGAESPFYIGEVGVLKMIDEFICEGENAIFHADFSLSYQWQVNTGSEWINLSDNPPYSGVNTDKLTIEYVSFEMNGYSYRAVDDSDNTVSTVYTLLVNPAPIIDIGSEISICSVDSVLLDAGEGFVEYLWSTYETSQTIIVNTTNKYSVTVTDDNGCIGIDSVEVAVHENPEALAQADLNVCEGNTFFLTGGPDTMESYLWSGPNDFTSQEQNPIVSQNATTIMTGVYHLTVTDDNGCIGIDSVEITIHENPVVIVEADFSACEGDTILLIGGPDDMESYLWSGPNDFTNQEQSIIVSQNADTVMTGTYTLTVENIYGCIAQIQTTVTVNPNPPAPDYEIDCSLGYNNAIITINSPIGDYSYSLNGEDFQESNIFESVANANDYQITIKHENGCETTSEIFGVICGCAEETILSLTETNGSTCGIESIIISGTFEGSATNVSIEHDGKGIISPESINTSPFSTNYTPHENDIGETVTISFTTNNPLGYPCIETIRTYSLAVFEIPNIIVSNDGPICEGELFELNETGGDAQTWTWTSNGDALITNTDEQNPIVTNAINGEVFTVSITDINGCKNSGSTSVIINVNPTAFTKSNAPVCEGEPLTLSGSGGIFYSWSGPNGFNSTNQNPTISQNSDISMSGTYYLTITDENDCIDKDSIIVLVYSSNFQVEYNKQHPKCFNGNDGYIIVKVTGGEKPYIFEWNNDEKTYSTDSLTGLSAGIYNVTITDNNGCNYVLSDINIYDGIENCIEIPDAFTPNDDGINDEWIIENIENFPEHSIQVFNRWGQEVFNAKHGEEWWNGGFFNKKNKPMPAGAYVYIIRLKQKSNNQKDDFIGIVTIIR